MSTVLEKAVLLDETGQSIVGMLEEIKEAINGSGEFTPILIKVTTPPTKTSYYVGDALDLSGIVVKLEASNGALIDVTDQCTFSPSNGAPLTLLSTSIVITYHWYKDDIDFTTTQPITVNAVVPLSIAVTSPPTKTDYLVGDTLDLTGMVVKATMNNGTVQTVTASCVFSPANGDILNSEDIDEVVITYTYQSTTFSTAQSITVVMPIYGVEWDGTATALWSRTDAAIDFTDPVAQKSDGDGGWTQGSSPFDNILPWSGMEIVEDENAGTLVKIPKFYFKWTRTGAKMKLQISPKQVDGFYVSPAHADRGDGKGERDFVYIARYNCASTNLKSISGDTAKQAAYTRAQARTAIHNLGSDIWQNDFAMFWTVRMLYLVEFADWNSEKVIGCGPSGINSRGNMGATDSMTYHTGTSGTGAAASNIEMQYRHIEGLYSSGLEYVDGVYFNNAAMYIVSNPADFSDNSGGTLVGQRIISAAGTNKVVTEWTSPDAVGFEYALYPSAVQNPSSQAYWQEYSCDSYNSGSSSSPGVTMSAGGTGSYGTNTENGLFYFSSSTASGSGNSVYRLMKLP